MIELVSFEPAGVLEPAAEAALEEAVRSGDLVRAVQVAAESGASKLVVASEPAGQMFDEAAASAGMVLTRELLQLRRPLPLPPEVSEAGGLEVRAFRPGVDDEAWLEVNHRAFSWHPEQGDWDLATLRSRFEEPWFDASGFLLHFRELDGVERLAGFCWTKVHADHDPPLGEIYVIGVDPDFQGLGLGRSLTVAGLDHLASRGLRVGMLYVESTNEAALGLYRKLGFETHQSKRWYTWPA